MIPVELMKVNGKKVSFRKIGNGQRRVLFFHGFPGSSAQIEFFTPILKTFDLEVICVDRPGYHRSESAGDHHLEFILETNAAVTQKFGWTHFELLSVSGGTPYLFSFARKHSEQIKKITIVSGLMPVMTPDFKGIISAKTLIALKVLPFIHNRLLKLALPPEVSDKKPNRAPVLRHLMPVSSEDQAIMQNPEHALVLRQSLREALMQGGNGPKSDARYYTSAWSTDLPERLSDITIWHGKSDLILPFGLAKKLASLLPRAKLNLIENEGHYSLSVNQVEQILS